MPAPVAPETLPVASMVMEPAPNLLASIPLAPVTFPTSMRMSASLEDLVVPASAMIAVPDVLSISPVALMVRSPDASVVPLTANCRTEETLPAEIEIVWDPVPVISAKMPLLPAVTVATEMTMPPPVEVAHTPCPSFVVPPVALLVIRSLDEMDMVPLPPS